MKTNRIFTILAVCAAMMFTVSVAFAASDVKLTVGTGTGSTSGEVGITITADGTGDVAGAAFTITHDAAVTVTVNSDFFGTFVAQGFTQADDGLDANDQVDGFDKPVVTNSITGGTAVAAARKDAQSVSGGVVLFTLAVSSSTAGTYPISIVATNLNNTDAGYLETGVDIDLLIGIEGPDYPVMLAAADVGTNVTAGSVELSDIPTVEGDDDGDLMTDSWEEQWFGDTTSSEGGDADIDGDGFTDVTEFQRRNDNDKSGKAYCPIYMNKADDTDEDYIPASRKVRGDVNGDGKLDMVDVKNIFLIKSKVLAATITERAAANVLDDGDSHVEITIDDVKRAFLIFSKVVPADE